MKKEPEFTADQIKDLVALKKNIAASAALRDLRKKFDWLKDYRTALAGEGIEVDGVGRIAYKESLTLMVQ